MYEVGPYRFTDTDARKTVQFAHYVWQLIEQGRDASVIAHLSPQLDGDLAHDLPAVWNAWIAAGEALRAAGQLPARTEGRVTALHASGGGVPKQPIERAEVGWTGVVGDRQRNRTHHGRPWQALCVWSEEVIDAFRAQGRPLAPGYAGENITVAGLPWADVRPGVRLRVGNVLCVVSSYAIPCVHNKNWFIDGDFELMHHDRGPVSRVYATVREPGAITTGDPAVLEP